MNTHHDPRVAPSTFSRRRFAAALWWAAAGLALPLAAGAAPVDDGVTQLQREWEVIQYQSAPGDRERQFETLAAKAHQLSESHPANSEPLVWEGIITSSLAGAKGGIGALSLVKQAKVLYEKAIQIDGNALEGSAYNSLGVLYYKVPGWPLGFGDKAKAAELLQKALSINPNGIDPNYFYADYLVETRQGDKAVPYLERALQAPPRPGRQIADSGRREEARQLLAKVKAK
jgi:tetratricopeptide (TPR) repeat protein